ncbi:hypothetical protein VHUM_04243 [Vanrija humicola]|uniref:NADH dehydrogenase [ubiquinone] 1 alpha subcomplex subunit 6 n=1 Tax=Vanrija humicola TaxID=5417 RepID=A0A7D8YW67_VANHU|nr:hypothetical protein VHUM_04243 [Vanrija humicola]
MFPARLARKVTIATTREEARVRVIDAYRAWYRSAPEICALYALNVSPSALRLKFRQDFEKNRHLEDLGLINVLLHKNQQEYQETMNCWKQEPHLLHWFKSYEDPAPPVSFLDKFYSGRDDPKQVNSF